MKEQSVSIQTAREAVKGAVLIMLMLLPEIAGASAADYGSASVFSMGSGTRSSAMGGAFTALSDDSSGISYNPAGLINMVRQQVTLTHYPLLLGTLYNSVSYAQPLLDFGTAGIALYRLYSAGIDTYDSSDIAGGTAVFEEYKGTVSYARRLSDNFSFGVNVNVFNFSVLNISGNGFGADLGALYEPFDFLTFGFLCRNIIKPVLGLNGSKEELPQSYAAGALLKFNFKPVALRVTVDSSRDEQSSVFKYRAGIELEAFELLCVRAGYDDSRISLGGGFTLAGAQVDYCYCMDSYLGALSRFSVSYNFGMTLEQQKKSRETAQKEQVKRLVADEFRNKELDKAKGYLDKGLQFYRDARYQEAMDEADKALAWAKDYLDAKKLKEIVGKKLVLIMYNSGLKSYKKGDLINALEYFKNVCAFDRGYREAGGYIELIDKKLRMKSGAREMFAKGVELYVNKQYEEAMDSFGRALVIEPDSVVIRTYISKTRSQMRKAGGGRILTDEQAQLVKKLYYNGLKQYTAGDLKGAEKSWKDALDVNPDDIKVLKSIEKAQDELAELAKRGIK